MVTLLFSIREYYDEAQTNAYLHYVIQHHPLIPIIQCRRIGEYHKLTIAALRVEWKISIQKKIDLKKDNQPMFFLPIKAVYYNKPHL